MVLTVTWPIRPKQRKVGIELVKDSLEFDECFINCCARMCLRNESRRDVKLCKAKQMKSHLLQFIKTEPSTFTKSSCHNHINVNVIKAI